MFKYKWEGEARDSGNNSLGDLKMSIHDPHLKFQRTFNEPSL